jgi:O-antigen/teichoic acid export membrane protein
MSLTKRIFFGAAASWFSRGMTILLGLVLLPVLFRTLPKEELGVWLLLGQSWATLGILDLGFGVTLTRRIAFAKGRSGSDPNAPLTDATRAEIADLIATGLRLYRGLAALSFAVSFGLGFFYLRSLTLDAVALPAVWTAWGVLCVSQALTVWATPWTCLLQGVGYIGWDAILASFVSALTLIGQIIAALCGGGLVSLAIVAAAGALLQRTVILGFARRKRPELFHLRGQWRGDTFREMLPLAGRAWLTAIGIVIVQNTDQFFIAGFEGAREIPAYRGAYLILLNIHMMAHVFASASVPFIGHLWQEGDLAQVRAIVERNARIGLLIVGTGAGCVLGLGPVLFDVWLGPGNFVGYQVVWVFAAFFFLEQLSYIMSTSCRATGDEAFAGWTMVAGAIKLTVSYLLAPVFGLLGIALGTLIAQVVTNHWYMVLRTWQRLQMSGGQFLLSTLLPCMLIMAGTLTVVRQFRVGASSMPPVAILFVAGAFSGLVLAIGWWCLVMKANDRRRFSGWARRQMGAGQA